MRLFIDNILQNPETICIPLFAFLILFGLFLRAVISKD